MYNKTIKDNQEIDPIELKKKIDNNEDIFILDVRTPTEYEAWKLSYDKHENPKLIPVDRLFTNTANLTKEIPKDKEIVTVCAHGNRSLMATRLLARLGYNVKSVKGGMAGWNKVYDVAEIPIPEQAPFKIWQIRRVSKGCIGYAISSKEDKTVAVIDPSREIYESFLNIAKVNELQLTKIIDTHQHADHVSGVAKLVKTISKEMKPENILAYFSSREEYDDSETELRNIKYIDGGDEINIGKQVTLKTIHTPGHTNGGMSFLLQYSNNSGNDIQYSYLFTGDTLFVDGVGRPDLREETKKFAEDMYNTYHQKISHLPDNTMVLPAHFNNMSISLKHGVPIIETIGSLKKKINMLSMNKEEFVSILTDTLPPRPMNYRTIISINKKMLTYDEIETPDLESGPNSCSVPSSQP